MCQREKKTELRWMLSEFAFDVITYVALQNSQTQKKRRQQPWKIWIEEKEYAF